MTAAIAIRSPASEPAGDGVRFAIADMARRVKFVKIIQGIREGLSIIRRARLTLKQMRVRSFSKIEDNKILPGLTLKFLRPIRATPFGVREDPDSVRVEARRRCGCNDGALTAMRPAAQSQS